MGQDTKLLCEQLIASLGLSYPGNLSPLNFGQPSAAGDITTPLAKAITAAGNAGGGMVTLPPGIWISSPVTLPNHVWLVGPGMRASTLKLANGSNDSLIKNFVSPDGTLANAEYCGVLNMMLDGNKANQSGTSHGIRFNTNPTTSIATNDDLFDTLQLVQNVFMNNCLTDGFNATGRSGIQLHNVQVYNAGRHSFLPSFDTEMNGCISGNAGVEGFYLTQSSVRLTNCKSFFSGQGTASLGYGFHIVNVAGGVSLSSCEAQDNTASGFVIDTCHRATLSACVADSNSTSGAGLFPGLDVFSATDCLVEGLVCYERQQDGVHSWQTHALQVRSGSTNNRISLTHSSAGAASISTPIMSSSDSLAGNDIRINAQNGFQTIVFASSITPDPFVGNVVEVTLTGAITINAPGNGPYVAGQTLSFIFIQDGTGGRVVTFNAIYKSSWTPNTAAGKINTILFAYDGTNWIQVGSTVGI